MNVKQAQDRDRERHIKQKKFKLFHCLQFCGRKKREE